MHTIGFIAGIGWQEATIILAVTLLVLGGRVPGLARSLGRCIIEFRQGLRS
jgi:Sec-independent protein translocase protein TatA